MKKNVSILIIILTGLLFSCNNSDKSLEGKWHNCSTSDRSFECTITKQGDVFNLNIHGNEFILEKKADGLYSGGFGGMITARYDKSTQHLFLSGYGDGYGGSKYELCK